MSDEAAQHLIAASQHLRGADHELKLVLTILRQEGRDVPSTIEEALACLRDALDILDS